VAVEGLTCLVLSPATPAPFAGRGDGARLTGPAPGAFEPSGSAGRAGHAGADAATARLDVTEHIEAKVGALCAYRSQFPLEPGMFPRFLLEELFREEYFVQVLPPRQFETELF